jgi:hypothetical protein
VISVVLVADRNQSFLVGWINIAGWLTLVTTEAVFGGEFDRGHLGSCLLFGKAGWLTSTPTKKLNSSPPPL